MQQAVFLFTRIQGKSFTYWKNVELKWVIGSVSLCHGGVWKQASTPKFNGKIKLNAKSQGCIKLKELSYS